ncbi:hypothetical protein [Streptosporangium roseum]|uniref:hypothetical protein n=1 Tax=Streptosporangium roseum TaxID=2001 RepID=UPI0012DDEA1E|nr:hypothetical protein [Streptosporangium roseum]
MIASLLDVHGLGRVVDHVGHQTDPAEHRLAITGVIRVGHAAVVRVGADDEQLVDQGAERLGRKARDLGADGGVEVDLWSIAAVAYRAELTGSITSPACSPTPVPQAEPDLPDAWWTGLRARVETVAASRTGRQTISAAYVERALPATCPPSRGHRRTAADHNPRRQSNPGAGSASAGS